MSDLIKKAPLPAPQSEASPPLDDSDDLARIQALFDAESGDAPGTVPGAKDGWFYFAVPLDAQTKKPRPEVVARLEQNGYEPDPDGLAMVGFMAHKLYRIRHKARAYMRYLRAKKAYEAGLQRWITRHVSPKEPDEEAGEWLRRIHSM